MLQLLAVAQSVAGGADKTWAVAELAFRTHVRGSSLRRAGADRSETVAILYAAAKTIRGIDKLLLSPRHLSLSVLLLLPLLPEKRLLLRPPLLLGVL